MSKTVFKSAFSSKFLKLGILLSLLFPAIAKPVKAQNVLLNSSQLNAQAKPAQKQHPIYLKAQKELNANWYTVYRITERIARANGLDESTWRVQLINKYDINAFATEVNLIALYSGIIDQLYGDTSALACVISHEMAHHTRRHIATTQAEVQSIAQQKQEEITQEVTERATEATAANVAEGVVNSVGIPTFGIGGIFGRDAQRRAAKAQKQKVEEFKARVLELNRKNELEADETGYVFAVRAGFEPEGCLRVMNVLSRTPTAEIDSTHPNIPSRIAALQETMTRYPATALKTEGSAKIQKTQPLTYNFSADGVSLRINSRFGSSPNQDFQRLFGQ